MSLILIYAMNYAPELAGVGRYTGEIGERLAARGHEVIVVTTPPHYPGWKAQPPYAPWRWTVEIAPRLAVFRCPLLARENMGGIWRLIAPLSFAVSSAPAALWQILRRRPDVVLCVEPTLLGAPLALLAAKLIGAATALHVQDLEVDAAFAVGHLASWRWLKSLALGFERGCLTRFDTVVTISRQMSERLAAKGVDRSRLRLVRNWVDLDRIRPLDRPSAYRAELGLAASDRVALYSGAIGAKQGFGAVLAAAERLADDPSVKFVIAGEGPAKAALQARAARLNNVRLLPFQPDERLREFLALADVHILPQAAEAADLMLPSKLGGMLASGKPIVVTAAPGTELADFLGDAGVFAPPGDGAALAAAITRVLAAPASAGALARLRLAGLLSRREGLEAFEDALLTATPAAPTPRLPGLIEQRAQSPRPAGRASPR